MRTTPKGWVEPSWRLPEVCPVLSEKLTPLIVCMSDVGFASKFWIVTTIESMPVVTLTVAFTGRPPAVAPVGVTNVTSAACTTCPKDIARAMPRTHFQDMRTSSSQDGTLLGGVPGGH